MFVEVAATRKSIGDVDIVFHDGLYHLFHLVLPNHDYIAHAISDNCLNWRRVDNALFIGDPGSWDDLMLWTMHVSPDPHREGSWRMFYTGLSRRDQGKVQRVGLAVSEDLFHWTKAAVNWEDQRGEHDPPLVKEARQQLSNSPATRIKSPQDDNSCFPLEATSPHYEVLPESSRDWISFRDPYFCHDGTEGWLLMAARVPDGPMIRRGCVGLMKETTPNHFESQPPLHAPMYYDDIEVPNLFRMDDECYLIGSLREDAKIRYWHSPGVEGPWRNYADNVLLPKGNYAGRICRDDKGWLLWNFYNTNIRQRTANNVMPPPKRIVRTEEGQLKVSTFEGLTERATDEIDTRCVLSLKHNLQAQICRIDDGSLTLESEAGFEGFVFEEACESFLLQCEITLEGAGKCGLLSRIDPDSHDGYYLSLDLAKGVAEYRCWLTRCDLQGDQMMHFEGLQRGYWQTRPEESVKVQLLSFGSYHELSVNNQVILSLVDASFREGLLGLYAETARLRIDQLSVRKLENPGQADNHLTEGSASVAFGSR